MYSALRLVTVLVLVDAERCFGPMRDRRTHHTVPNTLPNTLPKFVCNRTAEATFATDFRSADRVGLKCVAN